MERLIPRTLHSSQNHAALLVGALYCAADYLLNKVALGDGWQVFWPLNGITIALLLMQPRRRWPLLLLAISIGTGVGEYGDGNPLVSAILQRAISVLEVTLSALLLPPFVTLESWLRAPRLYPRFAAAVIVGPVVSGVLAANYFHAIDGTPFPEAFNAWASADAMGIAAVLPLVLALRSTDVRDLFRSNKWAVGIATLVGAIAVLTGIFASSRYPLIFVLYPLLMLVDWLLGLLGSSIALCCACVIAVFLTEHGFGPFTDTTALGMSRNIALQLYLGFHLIGFLPISILFLEQRRMDRELREALAQTALLAAMDGLTNVANRRTLDGRLAEQWRISARAGTSLALLMVDADYFKDFNDRFGHQAGDECLRAIAMTLRAQVSRPADLVARFGGEEFAVLLPDTPLEGAQRVAERIRAAVAELTISHAGSEQVLGQAAVRRITVSVGCAAIVPRANVQFCRLVELADQALYLAKRAGRDRVCVADSDLDLWSSGTAAQRLRARLEDFRRNLQR